MALLLLALGLVGGEHDAAGGGAGGRGQAGGQQLLLGLGIREFSMGPRSVPLLKDVARCASAADAARMARAALSLSTPDDVAALLAREAEALLSGDPETRAAVNA